MNPPATDSAPQRPDACLHFHALFLDTHLDVVWSPGLGRRIRTLVARLVKEKEKEKVKEKEKEAAR
ncbi:hypothetical protein STRCI_007126 [Streptomyces cinnabarinus]|uniref:Uncharacterized protein n=1 Tax=Streptomyces cinnabarinus TaxID=67287 RepID=A0ABY7KM31_9ACTN|nr:hypothetical protein [Streptomyces cinnabarinus]WAZ25618.1 hypothetical protein STRCI_007126 [Streptomyces cinnabarinus]